MGFFFIELAFPLNFGSSCTGSNPKYHYDILLVTFCDECDLPTFPSLTPLTLGPLMYF